MELPTYATILLLLVFLAAAIFPPRLHFGIRFLVLLGMAVVAWLLGNKFELYFPIPGLPEDTEFPISMLDLQLFAYVGFILSFIVAVIAWIVRKVMGRGAAPAEG